MQTQHTAQTERTHKREDEHEGGPPQARSIRRQATQEEQTARDSAIPFQSAMTGIARGAPRCFEPTPPSGGQHRACVGGGREGMATHRGASTWWLMCCEWRMKATVRKEKNVVSVPSLHSPRQPSCPFQTEAAVARCCNPTHSHSSGLTPTIFRLRVQTILKSPESTHRTGALPVPVSPVSSCCREAQPNLL